jgi:AraC family transcriptional regulator
MDWVTGIQKAIDFIEDNLAGELDYEKIAQNAYSSIFQFQRVFSILCGYTLGEYIRSRRLTLAGSELSCTDAKVIDVSLKYGYDSPESFTRAFVKFHGITPSQAKKDGSHLKSFSRVSVQIILKGGSIMDYKIEERPAFKVIEKVENVSINDEINRNTIPDFWTRSKQDGTIPALCSRMSGKKQLFGICYGNIPKDAKEFGYAISAMYDGKSDVPDGFRVSEIPAHTWAVFHCKGAMPDAIQNMWHRICAEFFPTSEYQPTYEMDIEVYPDGDMNSPDYESEIWVAVKKK